MQFVEAHNYAERARDTWPLFRNLKLPFIAHHLDFKEIGLPELPEIPVVRTEKKVKSIQMFR